MLNGFAVFNREIRRKMGIGKYGGVEGNREIGGKMGIGKYGGKKKYFPYFPLHRISLFTVFPSSPYFPLHPISLFPFSFSIVSLFLLISFGLRAQPYNPLSPPNTYRNQDNPYYWKNRPPKPGYWQQDVHYRIKAILDDSTNIVDGKLELTYWNNSPDELDVLYFHLYQNAFQPGSYLDDLFKKNNITPKWGKNESLKKCIETSDIKVDGKSVTTELDNTILKIFLNEKIKSGTSTEITMDFKTWFEPEGTQRRRMKLFNSSGYKHYDGVHWYPRICVYDNKFRWVTFQHLGKEFYGDFGTYDVDISLPNHYILDATGELQNKSEAMPNDLREKLDIKNFKDKKIGSKPSIIIPKEKGKQKKWIFHAENVHDFAWTADPTYRIGESEWNGIKCISLVQETHASGWLPSSQFTAWVIKTYSENFGPYVYHKIIAADAQDGMEYPMLTLDGGLYSEHQGLIAHEVGHNWFFGMVGNNETYRAFLDEGFTQFITMWAMSKYYREHKYDNEEKQQKVPDDTTIDLMVRTGRLYNNYLQSVIDNYDVTLNTHSDDFNSSVAHNGGYRAVYFKTGTMLYNLKYVLGDELFFGAMQHYFNKWKIAHPYPEDFRDAIIEYTKVDLVWFFDQWLETTKYIDYGITSVNKSNNKKEFEIHFKRNGSMQMPIEFTVTSKDNKKYHYYIPNTWFVKKFPAQQARTILPKWFGWDLLNNKYVARVIIPSGIKNVEIDPEHVLADIDLRDNSWKFPVEWKPDYRQNQNPEWEKTVNYWRPDLWFNSVDGFQTGFHLNGNYFQKKNIYHFNGWYNTGFISEKLTEGSKDKRQILSFSFSYKTPLNKYWRNMFFNYSYTYNAGLFMENIGIEKKFTQRDPWDNQYTQISVNYKSMYRGLIYGRQYLLYPELWNSDVYNNSFNLGALRKYTRDKVTGQLLLNVKLPGFIYAQKQKSYSIINFTSLHHITISKFQLKTRLFAQLGTGDIPLESSLYLAGANPEELMNNKYTRAKGFFPSKWTTPHGVDVNHFHSGGGLNLRGYSGYLAPENDGTLVYYSNSGISANFELDFDRWFQLIPSKFHKYLYLDKYLFSDFGSMIYKDYENVHHLSKIRMDGGVGTALNIRFGGRDINPLIIRFDMPLLINSSPFVSQEHLKFRWILGINRAF